MKSVVEVAFSGSWFCSSLTSRLRKSVELSELEALDDDVEVVAVVAADVAEDTVMTNLSSSRFSATERRS